MHPALGGTDWILVENYEYRGAREMKNWPQLRGLLIAAGPSSLAGYHTVAKGLPGVETLIRLAHDSSGRPSSIDWEKRPVLEPMETPEVHWIEDSGRQKDVNAANGFLDCFERGLATEELTRLLSTGQTNLANQDRKEHGSVLNATIARQMQLGEVGFGSHLPAGGTFPFQDLARGYRSFSGCPEA